MNRKNKKTPARQTADAAMQTFTRLSKTLPQAEWAQRLDRLATARASADQAEPAAAAHDQVQALLAFYIGDERQGLDAPALYLPVAAHLDSCAECRSTYTALTAGYPALEATDGGLVARMAAGAAAAANTVETWQKFEFPARGKRPARVEFHFLPRYLSERFNPVPTAPITRQVLYERGAPYGQETLLLNETLYLDDQEIWVQAWLVPARKPGRYHIHLEVSASARLKHALCAILNWQGQEYRTELPRGQAVFEDISLPDFSLLAPDEPTRDLSLRLEIIKK